MARIQEQDEAALATLYRRHTPLLRTASRLETEHEPQQVRHQGIEEDVNAADRAEIFKKLLAALPAAQREALHLAYFRGLSQREIAAKTGIPLGTIKTRLELAVRKIRTAILSLGGEEEWSLSHA
jgi:RNA polymerase sigma-70 factor (ECF subfamily)